MRHNYAKIDLRTRECREIGVTEQRIQLLAGRRQLKNLRSVGVMSEQSMKTLDASGKKHDVICTAASKSSSVGSDELEMDLDQEDYDAAETLVRLLQDSMFSQCFAYFLLTARLREGVVTQWNMDLLTFETAIRRLLNRNDRNLGRAVSDILKHAFQHPLGSAVTAQQAERAKRIRLKKKEVDVALTLIKLSGQSRADSKVALALMYLHHECMLVLFKEEQRQLTLAREADEARNAAEHLLALQKFGKEFPAVLRTSSQVSGRMLNVHDDVFVEA